MGESVLVFVSHSSEDKETLVNPIVKDLEESYINVWIDRKEIMPGDNLRKSILQNGLNKADIVLIFFTQQSLQSKWVDREIKHVLREETKKGNDFDLSKIISIFDCKETYKEISEKYGELTDDLLHLMPVDYTKIQLSQLVSAIWSKYLSLQGGDVETQRQILAKDREIFQKEKEIQQLKENLQELKSKNSNSQQYSEFEEILASGKLDIFIAHKDKVLENAYFHSEDVLGAAEARAFSFIEQYSNSGSALQLTIKGRDFFQWYLLYGEKSVSK